MRTGIVAAVLVAVAALAAPAQAELVFLPLKNLEFNQCVDVPRSSTSIVQLRIWTCNHTDAQNWAVVPVDGMPGKAYLKNKHSDYCMTVLDNSSLDFATVWQAPCTAIAAQQWSVGNPELYLPYKHGDKCLDTIGGIFSNLMQYTCDEGNRAQRWEFHSDAAVTMALRG